ncbi:rab-GTPase-TBC domain-containing protein [Gigaspora rosea]|uniref:Rab-GTPase-TBC domain-containing protein n=1 Tax=Gigaspora rosea TaxID=44941 RepID=A0A397U717_9GLOM|nr:rab-GTPase-TBC domain-containing protein [Gigaspora rosea]
MNFLVDEMVDDENSGPKDERLEENYPPPSNNVISPLLAREKDVVYQFQRVALFSELLRQYPASRDEIIHQAKVDIPPFLRGKIWAAIFGVNGDYQSAYDAYDKETEKEIQTDRQIDVDVPRCHQYHQLLSSPVGHEKLRRLLKCFVAANKQKLVYWQGLDSLCAPFLTLLNDEALAFSCFHAFIPKFMKDFFISDNTPVMQEYIAPTPIEVKKAELATRISLKDLVKLKNYVLVIGTKTEQVFGRGHFSLLINMNSVHLEQLTQALWQEKKKYHVVVGFASDLVNAGFPRVAVLNGGIDVMRVMME